MSLRFLWMRLLGLVIIVVIFSGIILIEYFFGKSDFFCLNNIVVYGCVFVKYKI